MSETRGAARLLRQIRAHERACQWSCDDCKAKLRRHEDDARRQRDAEAAVRLTVGTVSDEFRAQSAELMRANDGLLRRLADS